MFALIPKVLSLSALKPTFRQSAVHFQRIESGSEVNQMGTRIVVFEPSGNPGISGRYRNGYLSGFDQKLVCC